MYYSIHIYICTMYIQYAAEEIQDHSFVEAPMSVIWARGQERDIYYHQPVPGEDHDFYGLDELKYHGADQNQRGSKEINFFGECPAWFVVLHCCRV